MDPDQLKLIDFYKNEDRHHKVKLYFGDTECENYWGDDWNDTPYEHNAGPVYNEFILKTETIYTTTEIILEPCDIPDCNSGWCKKDFKKRLTPCILVVPMSVIEEYDKIYGDYPTYTQAIGHPMVRRLYLGDSYSQVMNNINYTEPTGIPKREESGR